MNQPYSNYPPSEKDNEIDVSKQLHHLLEHKKAIGLAILLGALAGGLYSFSASPVYRADAMLELQTKQNQILNEINSLFSSEPSPSEAEIELIQSRLVIGKTVEDLQLDQSVTPKYFPVFGQLAHNLSSDTDPELKIQAFTVSEEWHNKPIILTAADNQHYSIKLPDGSVSEGRVGQPLKVDNRLVLQINQILANAGQQFTLTKFSRLNTINQINQNFSVISKGKTSPILNLGYVGSDPKQIENILNSIINNYVSQNKDRDVQVAANGLAFISEELPRLREALQDAENRLNEYRMKSGSLDIPIEAKSALESLASIEAQITTLKTEEAGLAELYTKEHPALKSVLDKLSVLEQAKNKINRQIAVLPNTQQEVIRLTRDVDTNQATYMQLLNKQQELNILRASAQGNVRVVDQAVTAEQPIKPRKGMIILMSALTAGLAASAWFLLRSSFRRTVTSPEEIEMLGLEVAAVIPLSETQKKRDAQSKRLSRKKTPSSFLLAAEDSSDIAVEAIRSLRTGIHFAMMNTKNKVLMISGATPEVGKSFISANLATVMAQSGKKTLLIDADMRKGYLHRIFGLNEETGLAEILAGDTNPMQAVQTTKIENLEFISHGKMPDHPSELLMSNRLYAILEWAKQRYDYVIVDTPPILAVTDAAVIGQFAGNTMLVAHHNRTTPRELEISMQRFAQNSISVKGVIFNGLSRSAQNGHSYYAYAKYAKK
ncbi:polysaccharide biosynthesis tyrosine autokinase [Neisseria sp. S1]|uniref:polysaccharide biosynthesis tyrosine autokinase n=1 Tax=Neisseria sp. S1 TaxID=3318354 RepID=UPI003A8BC5A8